MWKQNQFFNEPFCPTLITFFSILNDRVPDVALLQSLKHYWYLIFFVLYILSIADVFYVLLLSIYKHMPFWFFLFFGLLVRGDQILRSRESLVLAHLIWSIIKLTFHFPIWWLLLCKSPVCTRLCWLKLLLHQQFVYRIFCSQRGVCNAARHISPLKNKSQFVKVWMNICHSLKPFPRNCLSFHPAFGFHIHFAQPLPQPGKQLKFTQQLDINQCCIKESLNFI